MSAISESVPTPSTRHFTFRRIHSLVGVLPLGAFVVYHFWFHAYSHQGAAVYDQKLAELYASPLKHLFAWLTVYLLLSYHSLYGLFITREARGATFAMAAFLLLAAMGFWAMAGFM